MARRSSGSELTTRSLRRTALSTTHTSTMSVVVARAAGALRHVPVIGVSVSRGHLESVIDPGGPVGGRDRQRELDDLFLVELGAQRLQIGLLDILRAGGQEVGIPQNGLLLGSEEAGLALASRLF